MKQSFILHLDSLEILDELTPIQKAELFDAIRAYNLGEEPVLSETLKMVFVPFRNQFKRDLEKYDKRCETNRSNGSKGGKQKVANASKGKQSLATLADKDSDKDKERDSKKELQQQFSSWAIESKLDIGKVLNQVDIAYMHYESQGFKDKYQKPITDLVVQIRKHWFKNLDEYKEDRGIVIDRSPVN